MTCCHTAAAAAASVVELLLPLLLLLLLLLLYMSTSARAAISVRPLKQLHSLLLKIDKPILISSIVLTLPIKPP
jgi:hypothetical protein